MQTRQYITNIQGERMPVMCSYSRESDGSQSVVVSVRCTQEEEGVVNQRPYPSTPYAGGG